LAKSLTPHPRRKATHSRLEEFCQGVINNYQEDRNFPAVDGTSRLSAALKFGAIGIRTIWTATLELLENCRAQEAKDSIITWQARVSLAGILPALSLFFPRIGGRCL
jgi:deoxyribodipyrimidine photo-lyase